MQAVIDYNYCKSGKPGYRAVCLACHRAHICAKNNVTSPKQLTAKRQGMTVAAYSNLSHPTRKHKKHYCENIDGRLGYKCNCTIHDSSQLEVDHIDGNPFNNDPSNLQTLCANCHKYKTHKNKDHISPGRTTGKKNDYDHSLDSSPRARIFDWQKIA
jgi:hypothetical protein